MLGLNCEEALYGGSVGGAKTICLLLYLAQGIHLPDYTGGFFRRTWAECHGGNDSPLAKAYQVYGPLGATRTDKTWTFPSGAKIVFGHLDDAHAHLKYQGPSFHRMAFDELTHFTEDQYTWMIAYRIRRKQNYPLVLGVRTSANPGGPGHDWVKERFLTEEAMKTVLGMDRRLPCPPGMIFWKAGRAYVPARLADNPYLDIDDYELRMVAQGKSPVERARMMNGDWSIREDGIIKLDWLRRYTMRGDMLQARGPNGEPLGDPVDSRNLQRFATIDTAGTSEEKARDAKGKPPSWSVCMVWDYAPRPKWLFLRHVWRQRVDWDGLKAGTRRTLTEWRPRKALIENAHFGQALFAELKGLGPELFGTGGKGKLERSTNLQNMLEAGQVFLPQVDNVPGGAAWLPILESEWLGWTGLDEETNDQIDTASMAANHVKRAGGSWGGPVHSGGLNRIGTMV